MDLVKKIDVPTATKPAAYKEIITIKHEASWEELKTTSLLTAVYDWLGTLGNKHTKKNYTSAFNQIFAKSILNPNISLQQVHLMNLDNVVDSIKQVAEWSEASRQSRCASLLAF